MSCACARASTCAGSCSCTAGITVSITGGSAGWAGAAASCGGTGSAGCACDCMRGRLKAWPSSEPRPEACCSGCASGGSPPWSNSASGSSFWDCSKHEGRPVWEASCKASVLRPLSGRVCTMPSWRCCISSPVPCDGRPAQPSSCWRACWGGGAKGSKSLGISRGRCCGLAGCGMASAACSGGMALSIEGTAGVWMASRLSAVRPSQGSAMPGAAAGNMSASGVASCSGGWTATGGGTIWGCGAAVAGGAAACVACAACAFCIAAEGGASKGVPGATAARV